MNYSNIISKGGALLYDTICFLKKTSKIPAEEYGFGKVAGCYLN